LCDKGDGVMGFVGRRVIRFYLRRQVISNTIQTTANTKLVMSPRGFDDEKFVYNVVQLSQRQL